LGFGVRAQSPSPNPQSPIPNPQLIFHLKKLIKFNNKRKNLKKQKKYNLRFN